MTAKLNPTNPEDKSRDWIHDLWEFILTRRIKSQKVYREIDWTLLLTFVGLFIVVAGLEKNLLTPELIDVIGRFHLESVPILTVVTAVL